MIKKKFINPSGAYIVIVKQMKKDGLTWHEVGDILGTSHAYPQSIIQGKANPKYAMVEKANVGITEYCHTHESYKRHLRKVVEVYEPDDCVEWLETHDDFEFLVHALGYVPSHFEKHITQKLRDRTIKFLAVSELTWIIDEWDNTDLGDFNLDKKQFYSAILKGAVNGSK